LAGCFLFAAPDSVDRIGDTVRRGLLYGSGDGIGPPDRPIAEDQMQMLVPMLRIFVNDLDSICAALALARVDPGTKLMVVLLGVPYSPEFEQGRKSEATRH
jgi:hypothetical protein